MPASRKALTLFDDYRDMMADSVRLNAYRDAIESVVNPGDVVLDLGCGLGILSFMALRAGAERVVAVEQTDAVELARAVAQHNGFADRIEFVHANSLQLDRPAFADVIVSETLGSFGLEENTLAFTIDARDRLLRPGGSLLPRRLLAVLAPVTNPRAAQRADFWRTVDGFDFAPAATEQLTRMTVETIAEDQLLAEPQLYANVDLYAAQQADLEGTPLFGIERAGVLHGLAGWFEVELAEDVMIGTAPWDPPTHWRQAYFPFREAHDVVPGDFLEVTLRIRGQAADSDNSVVSYDYRCTQIAGG